MKKRTLLSKGTTNAKTAKNEIETFILYMSPHTKNDKKINLCPNATTACVKDCLFFAGRGAFSNVMEARTRKSNFFVSDPAQFIRQLVHEILKECAKAKRKGTKIAFRLNGTTDIDWPFYLKKYGNFTFETVEDVATFYDYTKVIKRIKKYGHIENYFLTFSRSESNAAECSEALQYGANIAVVFDQVPDQWNGTKVINGDTSDLVMLGNKGKILGLKAKGKARTDKTGFVVRTADTFQESMNAIDNSIKNIEQLNTLIQ
jgi:hypothetical protein